MNDSKIKPKKNRGYLLCDNCGGSYELQEGESPEDFSDKCECGGNLNHTRNLSNTNTGQSRSNDEFISTVDDVTAKIKEGSIIDQIISYINWKILIIGGLLIIILTLGSNAIFSAIYGNSAGDIGLRIFTYPIILLIISGLAGYLLRKNNSAAIHGGLIGLAQLSIGYQTIAYLGLWFLPIILGVIGGIAGVVLRKRIKKDEKLDQKVEKAKGKVGDVLDSKNIPDSVKDKLGDVLDSSTKRVPTDQSSPVSDPYEEIKKAKELLDMGALTEEEFREIKKKILD